MVVLMQRQYINIQEGDMKHTSYTGTIQLQEIRETQHTVHTEQSTVFSQGGAGCI